MSEDRKEGITEMKKGSRVDRLNVTVCTSDPETNK